ncbi:hypothetical protein [Aerococcus vaginalis]
MEDLKHAFKDTLLVMGGIFLLVILGELLLPINFFANSFYYLGFAIVYFVIKFVKYRNY